MNDENDVNDGPVLVEAEEQAVVEEEETAVLHHEAMNLANSDEDNSDEDNDDTTSTDEEDEDDIYDSEPQLRNLVDLKNRLEQNVCKEITVDCIDLRTIWEFRTMSCGSLFQQLHREFQNAIRENTSVKRIEYSLSNSANDEECDLERDLFGLAHVQSLIFECKGSMISPATSSYLNLNFIDKIIRQFENTVHDVWFPKIESTHIRCDPFSNQSLGIHTNIKTLRLQLISEFASNMQTLISSFPCLQNIELEFRNNHVKCKDGQEAFQHVFTKILNLEYLSIEGMQFEVNPKAFQAFFHGLNNPTNTLQKLKLVRCLFSKQQQHHLAAVLIQTSCKHLSLDEWSLPFSLLRTNIPLKQFLANVETMEIQYRKDNLKWVSSFLHQMHSLTVWNKLNILPSRVSFWQQVDHTDEIEFYACLATFLENAVTLETLFLHSFDFSTKTTVQLIVGALERQQQQQEKEGEQNSKNIYLQHLLLGGCQFSDESLTLLLSNLPNLERIELRNCWNRRRNALTRAAPLLACTTCLAEPNKRTKLKHLIVYADATTITQTGGNNNNNNNNNTIPSFLLLPTHIGDRCGQLLCRVLERDYVLEELKLSETGLDEALISNPNLCKKIESLLKLNRFGRRYILDLDRAKNNNEKDGISLSLSQRGFNLLVNIGDDLDCIYHHLRYENPCLCKMLLDTDQLIP